MKFEILKIVPAIENQKHLFFGTPGFDFSGFQKARAPADHLPEFGVGVNGFGKHQIYDFTHIDAGVQHVHANGNARHILMGELMEQTTLAVDTRIIRYQHFGQFSVVLGIERVEGFLPCGGHGLWRHKKRWFCPAGRHFGLLCIPP